MNYFQSAALGLVQGLTEFLPVSSSGHLVIFTQLVKAPVSVSFDIFLHLASLLAVLIYFKDKLLGLTFSVFTKTKTRKADLQLIGYLAVGTVPAVIFGVLFKDQIEAAFNSFWSNGLQIMITGLIILGAEQLALRKHKVEPLNYLKAILIGIAQAIAILPGISRSGSTIAMALVTKIDRVKAAEFSFLLSIPAILGAFVFELKDLVALDISLGVLSLGFVVSFLASYLAIYYFIKLISKHSIKVFGYYCLVLGLLIVIFTR